MEQNAQNKFEPNHKNKCTTQTRNIPTTIPKPINQQATKPTYPNNRPNNAHTQTYIVWGHTVFPSFFARTPKQNNALQLQTYVGSNTDTQAQTQITYAGQAPAIRVY